jgi:general stress protein 26
MAILEEIAMTHEAEIAAKFWKALKSDMTVMLGLTGVAESHSRPMTAQFDGDDGRTAIWFFTARDTDLVKSMGQEHRAVAHFVSKGHDLFASFHGDLILDNDRATIDRLWNRFVAAWYPGGQEDPNLQLIRFEPDDAQIWLNENSLFAGIRLLLGNDPKSAYKDKVAEIRLG